MLSGDSKYVIKEEFHEEVPEDRGRFRTARGDPEGLLSLLQQAHRCDAQGEAETGRRADHQDHRQEDLAAGSRAEALREGDDRRVHPRGLQRTLPGWLGDLDQGPAGSPQEALRFLFGSCTIPDALASGIFFIKKPACCGMPERWSEFNGKGVAVHSVNRLKHGVNRAEPERPRFQADLRSFALA